MIKKWSIRVVLVFCCLVWLTAVYKGVPLLTALIRGIFSGLLIFVLTVLFVVGLNALGANSSSGGNGRSAGDNKQDNGGKDSKSHRSQIESDLIERLRDNPMRGAELISKMTSEGQVKD